jgi:hypothetical protein
VQRPSSTHWGLFFSCYQQAPAGGTAHRPKAPAQSIEEQNHEASAVRKADRVAKERAPKPRMHFFWWDDDETYDMVEARIRAKIASGEASENDRFVTFTWRRPEDEGADD